MPMLSLIEYLNICGCGEYRSQIHVNSITGSKWKCTPRESAIIGLCQFNDGPTEIVLFCGSWSSLLMVGNWKEPLIAIECAVPTLKCWINFSATLSQLSPSTNASFSFLYFCRPQLKCKASFYLYIIIIYCEFAKKYYVFVGSSERWMIV